MADKRVCSISGCGKKIAGLGYCKNHWYRFHKYGDPLAGATVHGEPLRYFTEVVLSYTGEDCLIWPYARDSNGYGQLRKDGTVYYVARLVCEVAHGAPPTPEHEAAHSCGKGHEACCAKSHLRWATVVDNHADKKIHGTYKNPPIVAKLTPSDVLAIRDLKGRMTQREIAKMFGVQHAAIGCIHRGKTWSNI
jgi:hypothetical protein